MSDFVGEYVLTAGGENVGTVSVRREGLMTAVECSCSLRADEILRLGVRCGGRVVPVGVLMPAGEGFYLKKRFSAAALRDMGIAAPCAFTIVGMEGAEEPDTPEEPPEEPADHDTAADADPPPESGDPELLLPEEYRGIPGASVSREGGDVILSAPADGDILPLMPVLTRGRAVERDGEIRLVFRFRDGEIV